VCVSDGLLTCMLKSPVITNSSSGVVMTNDRRDSKSVKNEENVAE
jgi:hypothetical protein